jgi:hypothetical protein
MALDIDLDRVALEARELRPRPGRAAILVVASLFFALGWLAGVVLTGLWLALAYSFTAARLGWRQGRSQVWALSDRGGAA